MNDQFGMNVFHFDKLHRNLPPPIAEKFRKTVDQKEPLDAEVADFVAREIKKWAESMEVTHYAHWFLPLTGLTAGKENTFLERTVEGRMIAHFSGRDLIKGEPDASSFPHGGMRSTFEAKGYSAWDPTSPVFVIRNEKSSILYIPSVFFGYNGKVLDKKTPLLRSLKRINDMSCLVLRRLRVQVDWVKTMVGPEQEFFLVSEKDFRDRPDLNTCGRILFAARPSKGQQMGDHYFGAIPHAVMRFLEDVEEEAFRLGIPIKTRHNEVAPNQFELAPVYEEANIAADHNQMLMDLMSRIARRHQMVCLFTEKPFTFFNGSGKHLNWSLQDSSGRNLFSPGESRSSRLVFLTFLTAFIVGIHRHHDLLQAVLASSGNELRLGGHEAPPAIISVYLGEELQRILRDMEGFVAAKQRRHKMIRLEDFIPHILHDLSDRNRTSPVAFTGNKFEFRMPGSSASLAFPITVVNLLMVDGLQAVSDALAEARDEAGILQALQCLVQENSPIVFEGDNYSEEWRQEAGHRRLFIPRSIPETIERMRHPKNIALFEKYTILQGDEIAARADIKIEMYVKSVEIELRVARYMLRGHIIPAALRNQELLLGSLRDYPAVILQKNPTLLDNQLRFIQKFTGKINQVMEFLAQLDEDNEALKEGGMAEKAALCAAVIRPHLQETAALVEKIEERVARRFWPLPRVSEILFR